MSHKIDTTYIQKILQDQLKRLCGLRSNVLRGMPHYETFEELEAQIAKARQQHEILKKFKG